VARPRRKSPWITTGEVFLWVLFFALLFPAAFAGWAVGHYTSLGGEKTKTVTVTSGGTTPTTTTSATTTATTTTSAGTTTAAAGGAALIAQGKTVYSANGCAACHTFAPANSSGTVGPNLDTAPTTDAKKANMPLPAFVKQSIVDPNAFISPGYPKGVMPTNFGTQISSTQLNALVAFIVSGAK
jgi:cytochrome c551/c552